MPRRGAVALLLTTAALALLLSFKTPAEATPAAGTQTAVADRASSTPTATTTPSGATAPETTGMPESTAAPAATAAPGTAAVDLFDGTVDGASIATRWGSVQVRVTIAGGAITDVTALQLPSGDHHSADISARVEPVLRSSALAAQSAEIDVVSGATYTSIAYAESLQAALDAARA
jgi:uncharacterized protein with FMN-binding domain